MTLDSSWLLQGDMVMLAMFDTMLEIFKLNSEGAAAGHLGLLQNF